MCFEIFDYDILDWSRVNFSLRSKYINYKINGWEIFYGQDIENLKKYFKDTLNKTLDKKCSLQCAEPDFSFVFNPNESVDFNIHFWCEDGHKGSNMFTMTLGRKEIDILYTYLQLVTNEIDVSSEKVKLYIDKGFFCE